ncbi:MAG: hypothetical protein D6800_14685 [Candidatus Zixiibacteriota bacterium]|nr:MAG: hypothetical protein D6800_14685 [candidate division Zixibacteria bacterium]
MRQCDCCARRLGADRAIVVLWRGATAATLKVVVCRRCRPPRRYRQAKAVYGVKVDPLSEVGQAVYAAWSARKRGLISAADTHIQAVSHYRRLGYGVCAGRHKDSRQEQ